MASVEKYKTDNGKIRWRVRYDAYVNGERIQRKKSFNTSKDANDFRVKMENAIRSGVYADAHGMTVAEFLEDWVQTYTKHLRPNTLADYKNSFKRFVIPLIGGERLGNLSTAMIQRAYNKVLEMERKPAKYETRNGKRVEIQPAQYYSGKTVGNIHTALHVALEQARREGLIGRNPADDVKLPKKEMREYTIPTVEQFRTIMEDLKGAECYLVILTCALLGCRRGEALGLYWSDIDFDANIVSLKRAYILNAESKIPEVGDLKTSNGRRTLPLPTLLKSELLAMQQRNLAEAVSIGPCKTASPFIFATHTGKPFRPDSISQALKRAAAKAGLPDMRLHDLRHMAITYMLVEGIDPKTVSAMAGHATAQFTLNQYAHVLDQSKRKAVDVLQRKLLKGATER